MEAGFEISEFSRIPLFAVAIAVGRGSSTEVVMIATASFRILKSAAANVCRSSWNVIFVQSYDPVASSTVPAAKGRDSRPCDRSAPPACAPVPSWFGNTISSCAPTACAAPIISGKEAAGRE